MKMPAPRQIGDCFYIETLCGHFALEFYVCNMQGGSNKVDVQRYLLSQQAKYSFMRFVCYFSSEAKDGAFCCFYA